MKLSKILSGIMVVAFILGLSLKSSQAVQYTGCLKSGGKIVKVAIGSTPLKPCRHHQKEISWNSEGPPGPEGPAGPKGTNGTSSSSTRAFQFIGVTDNTFHGSGGIVRFSQACRQKFKDLYSRMCTSKEIMLTVAPPDLESIAWVQPSEVISIDGGSKIRDFSGVQATTEDTLSCEGWTRVKTGKGLTFKNFDNIPDFAGFGQMSASLCDISASVACCAQMIFE